MHPAAEPEIRQQLDEVDAADRGPVEQVLAFAAPVESPRDRQLGIGQRSVPVGVVEEELDLAEVLRGASSASCEEHVVRLLSARSSDGASEPAAHTIASDTLDFPEPFGPTTTATPGSSRTSTGSGTT